VRIGQDLDALGPPLHWRAAERPGHGPLAGERVTLAAVVANRDAEPLWRVSHLPDGDPSIWTYMFDGPYPSAAALHARLTEIERSTDPLYYTVLLDGEPAGSVSYLRITPEHGAIEVGNIWFGKGLQRTAGATEAIFLLARHAFDELGYRRLEWKCNALNAPSRRAAERFGFSFEGIFRHHMVVKDRSRDTAWFAITDDRWPVVRRAFQEWLDPANFDSRGLQRRSLQEVRRSLS
jgi:RimJ/RimL family protein N-acetyltransferase